MVLVINHKKKISHIVDINYAYVGQKSRTKHTVKLRYTVKIRRFFRVWIEAVGQTDMIESIFSAMLSKMTTPSFCGRQSVRMKAVLCRRAILKHMYGKRGSSKVVSLLQGKLFLTYTRRPWVNLPMWSSFLWVNHTLQTCIPSQPLDH